MIIIRNILKITFLTTFIFLFPLPLYADEFVLTDEEKAWFKAAKENDAKTIEEIAKTKKVDLDARNESGETALHIAAALDHPKVIDVLYMLGANIDIRNNQMESPQDVAQSNGHLKTAYLLQQLELEADINANIETEDGFDKEHDCF